MTMQSEPHHLHNEKTITISSSPSPASFQFRRFHARKMLIEFDTRRGPLDLYIAHVFRKTTQLGSKDRAYISETIYAYFRWKILIEYLYVLHEKETKANCKEYWTYVFDLIDSQNELFSRAGDTSIPLHIRLSLPEELYHAIERNWKEESLALCLALNKPAPLTIRTNTQRISPQELLDRLLEREFPVTRDPDMQETLHFAKRVNLFTLPEFQEGFFEVQDKGSQKIARMIEAQEKQHILDYCSGSGGKSLAIAPFMHNSGQLYLHDVRLDALHQAKKRLKRAGVQHAQWIHASEGKKLKQLFGKMDWVLVDAPCSGTGTLRRNPDMKWKFSMEMVYRLQDEQKEILKKAVAFLAPKGRLVYATCSLLQEENEEIVEYAKRELGLVIDENRDELNCNPICKTAPHTDVWDGFFAIRLKRG